MKTDIKPVSVSLYFISVDTRVPLKFGSEVLTNVTCARVCLEVEDRQGRRAKGWGETPLSVQWTWPSPLSYQERHQELKQFCMKLAQAWTEYGEFGHPIEVGYSFTENLLPSLVNEVNKKRLDKELLPWLAALVCCSPFDIALHDAYGNLHQLPIYKTYNKHFMNRSLDDFLERAEGSNISFKNKYPQNYLGNYTNIMPAWHLVGGKDVVDPTELTGEEPDDSYPVILRDWIRSDGLNCLKIKLRGNDKEWDYERFLKIGDIAIDEGVNWLTADFNCTVTDPLYVNEILDKLKKDFPRIYGMILYVEQPFPYDLEVNQIDVHSVSARKPLFMDESAHDWKLIKLGRKLGWSGVALKACKTQTGAILSACWAKAHGMTLMVQDLTNPMLAQIPHVLLAANVGTIMGVETNSMQFYPEASKPEESIHPGLYKRRNGSVDLSSIKGPGFGYRISEIPRQLPEPIIIL